MIFFYNFFNMFVDYSNRIAIFAIKSSSCIFAYIFPCIILRFFFFPNSPRVSAA